MPLPIPTLIWKTGVALPPEPSGRGTPQFNIVYMTTSLAGITLAGRLNKPTPNEPGFTWSISDITGGTWTKQYYQGARAGGIFSIDRTAYMGTSLGGGIVVTAMDGTKQWRTASPATNAMFLRPVYEIDGNFTVLYASTGMNDANPIEYSTFDRFFPIRSVRNVLPQSGSESIYGMAIGPSGLVATSVLNNYAKKVKTWPPTGVGTGPVTYHVINPTSAGILDFRYYGGWYIAVDRTQPRLYCSRNGENWTTVTHPNFSNLGWNSAKIAYGAGVFMLLCPYQYFISRDPTGAWNRVDMGGSFPIGTDHYRPLFVDNSQYNKISYFVHYSGTTSGIVNSSSTVIYATVKNEQTSSFFSATWQNFSARKWKVGDSLNIGNIYTNANNLVGYSSTNNSVLEVRPANRLTDPNPGWYFYAKTRGTATVRAYASGNNIFEPLDQEVNVTVDGINQSAPYGVPASVASGSVYSIPPATEQGLALTYQSSNTNVAQIISNTSVRILRGGQSTITASNNGNTTYYPFSQSITVSTPTYNQFLNLKIANNVSPGYAVTLPSTTDAGLSVSYSLSPSNVGIINGNTLTIIDCGNATLTATNGGSVGYNPLNNAYSLNNVKCSQGLTIPVPGSVFKNTIYSLPTGTDVGLPVTYTLSNITTPSAAQLLSNTGITFIETGRVRLHWSNAGNSKYNPLSGSLTIISSRLSQTLNFNVPNIVNLGSGYALNTGSSVGLPITYASSNTGIARIINNSGLFITGCGSVNITATQSGNSNYSPINNSYSIISPRLSQNATISVPQKVTFGQKYLVPTFTSAGLRIRYRSSNSGVARIIEE